MTLEADARFARGLRLFNQGEFYECHEVLEEVWREAARADRFFLQAIIHLAVAQYHRSRGNRRGAARQLDKGLKKLAGYLPRHHGVDTAALYRDAATGARFFIQSSI